MQSTWMNGIKLFRVFGIDVFLHWSWALVAAFEIFTGSARYSSRAWNALEYLILFGIVLMHEFGHALACRSVGGTANRIMLWPLGGVAFVSPPARPGAMLWSIAAGPLVNVALLFVTIPLVFLDLTGDLGHLIRAVAAINAGLLLFNILPIYPLDGGQILQSLLWFVIGRGRSMAVATVIGMAGALVGLLLAVKFQTYYMMAVAVFVASLSWSGWKQGVLIRKRENAARRAGWACPACGKPPLIGDFWVCSDCNTRFDTFGNAATCPTCGKQFGITNCGECGATSRFSDWRQLMPPPPYQVVGGYLPAASSEAPPFTTSLSSPTSSKPTGMV